MELLAHCWPAVNGALEVLTPLLLTLEWGTPEFCDTERAGPPTVHPERKAQMLAHTAASLATAPRQKVGTRQLLGQATVTTCRYYSQDKKAKFPSKLFCDVLLLKM